MTEANLVGLSPLQLVERFDRLAADAREYAIFLVDPGGLLICWNAGAERLFGYRADEIVGQHFSRFFSPEDVRNGQPEHEIKSALLDGRADSLRWQVRKDGTRFWCKAAVTPMLDADKQLTGFARVMHDLTEGQTQEAQKKRADDLSQANRSREEFMALLAHELRNPLSPILNALNVLRQLRTDDPIVQQSASIIDRQVGQMVRLVDDLLDVGRMTKGKLRLSLEPVELRGAMNRAAESARPFLDARKHQFSLMLPTEPLWVLADQGRLEQIAVNLLNNAAKYTGPGGFIWMTVGREAGMAVVRVRDSGVGISREVLPHVFELFTQVDSSLSRSHGGLGIGLALVSALVEMHGGTVRATSAGTGKGSEFKVTLPALPDPAGREPTSTFAPGKRAGRMLRVLIAEDNVDSGDSLGLLLRLYGHEVLVTRTGPAALEAAPAFRPDLVLLDIGLPGLDGYEVARRLRAMPECKGAVLCSLSGYTPSEADQQRAERSLFDRRYVKPVSLETLLDLLKKVG
jgi:PAS domain S-box-containing protein